MRATKATTLIVTFVLIPAFIAAAGASFTDTGGHRYETSIDALGELGIVQGYDNGTFRPDTTINRAELLKILMEARYAELPTPEDLQCFSDLMVRVPQWYARPVCLARQLGIVGGYPDGSFKPGKAVNLAEALKIGLGAFQIQVDAAGPGMPWYEPYILAARQRGMLLELLATPDHLLTRGEMALITATLLDETETPDDGTVVDQDEAVCGNNKLEGKEQCDDGNLENSDGCSQLCILVPEPVRLAILQIDTNAAGTLTNIARGQKGVALLRFSATVDRQDTLFTGVRFTPSAGSLSYAQNYVLAMDRDGDGRYETTVGSGKAQGTRLAFDTLTGGGIRLFENIPVRFEVRADLTSSLGPVTLGLQFATSDSDYISANGAVDGIPLQGIETNNSCPNNVSVCFIRVNTRASADINVQQRGNLYVTTDSQPVRSQQVLGGTISDALLRLRLRADGEDVDLKTIRIDGGVSSIESLLLFRTTPGGSVDTRTAQPFAQATASQCPTVGATRFCANLSLNMLRVAANQETTIVVAAKSKDEQLGGVSGQTFTLNLSAATNENHAMEARGISSLADLVQNDGSSLADGEIFIGTASPGPSSAISGPANDTVLAKINGISNALMQTTVTGIPSGKMTFGGFAISAAAHNNSFHGSNDVIVSSLVINVTAQNVQIDPASYRLYNPENPAVGIACSAGQSTGSFAVTCSGIALSEIQSRIGQGQVAKYLLEANITNTEIAPGDSSLMTELAPLGQRNQTNAVIWSDEVTTLQWVDIAELRVQSTLYKQQ